MEWLPFTASLVDSVAWPLAVLVMVFLLRRPVFEHLRLRQASRFDGLEVEFTRRLEEATEEASTQLPAAGDPEALPPGTHERIMQLAQLSPRSAVQEAWREIEGAALDAAQRHRLKLSYRTVRSPLQVVRAMQHASLLDIGKVALFEDLRVLRNQAVHAPEVVLGTDDALAYGSLAVRLADYLASL